jgi:hypothetical protein
MNKKKKKITNNFKLMRRPWNRLGQFFLIAAVVIIVAVISIVTVSNYTQKTDVVKLYDLGEELGIESQQVLDYGTYNSLDEAAMKTLMENFIQNYVDYVGEGKNLYFLFGNLQKIYVIGYQQVDEDVCIILDPDSECVPIETMEETLEFPITNGEGEENKIVVISVGDTEYQFELNYGENFYFVIWQEIGGEKYVITNE